jgi:hypothetical protein
LRGIITAENGQNLQAVREEAMTKKLTEFTQKVAAARSAEITKLKNDAKQEAATAAMKILETKLRKQKEAFETQLVQLQQSSNNNNNSRPVVAMTRPWREHEKMDRPQHEAAINAQVRHHEYENETRRYHRRQCPAGMADLENAAGGGGGRVLVDRPRAVTTSRGGKS